MITQDRIVLASASQVRSWLLENAGLEFEVDPADINEFIIKENMGAKGVTAKDIAAILAETKAQVVSSRHPEAWIIGADQVLIFENQIYDKPADITEAASHLRKFKGRQHELISSVCVARENNIIWCYSETVRLHVREYSEAFLKNYLSEPGNNVLESVGAYRLEGLGAHLFSKVEGDYFSVLGLPLLPLLNFLREQGVISS